MVRSLLILIVACVLIGGGLYIFSQLPAWGLYMFNLSPVRFIDKTPIIQTVHVGQTLDVTVNAEENSDKTFPSLNLVTTVENNDKQFLKVDTHQPTLLTLNAQGQRTGDIHVIFTPIQIDQGKQTLYEGQIQLFSGKDQMDSRPFSITVIP